jgi:N-acyl-D-aspartate/D-glutamate deacylase
MTKVNELNGTFGRLTVGEVYHADNERFCGRTLGEVAKKEGKEVGEVLLDIALKGGVQSLSSEFKLEGVMNVDKQAISQVQYSSIHHTPYSIHHTPHTTHCAHTLYSYTVLIHCAHTLCSYTVLIHCAHTLCSYTTHHTRISQIVQHPQVQLGASDAGAHVTQFCGTGDTTYFLQRYVSCVDVHPHTPLMQRSCAHTLIHSYTTLMRSYTLAHTRRYVKEDKSLALELAVHKLTGK